MSKKVLIIDIGNTSTDFAVFENGNLQDFEDSRLGQPFAEEIHEFGDGGLGGHVVSADDADTGHVEAGLVASHLHRPCLALGDVEDKKPTVNGFLERVEEPGGGGGVA